MHKAEYDTIVARIEAAINKERSALDDDQVNAILLDNVAERQQARRLSFISCVENQGSESANTIMLGSLYDRDTLLRTLRMNIIKSAGAWAYYLYKFFSKKAYIGPRRPRRPTI